MHDAVDNYPRDIVQGIDLSRVTRKLALRKRWSQCTSEKAAEQYRRFLFLHRKYQNVFRLVPSPDIDAVWHEHILMTRQYHDDCITLFGRFLHHYPMLPTDDCIQFGLDGSEFNLTQQLYFQEFGQYIYDVKFRPMVWMKDRAVRFLLWMDTHLGVRKYEEARK